MPLDTLLQHFAPSGPEALSLLLTPGTDVAYVGMTPFALARRLGMPVQIVGIAQRLSVAHGVVVRDSLALSRKRSAKGNQTVLLGTIAGSTAHQIASDWALQERLNVRFVYLSPTQQLHAYRAGYVDGLACWEPFLTKARRLGGTLACDATTTGRPMFNIICATHTALARKSEMIRRFLEANASVSAELASGTPLDGFRNLPWLYGTTLELDDADFRSVVKNGYGWPSCPLSDQDKDDLRESLSAAHSFLERNGFPGNSSASKETFGILPSGASEPGILNVHCSDSFMCTAYHLAVIRGDFRRFGFRISIQSLSRGQRIALLRSEESRKEIVVLEARAGDDAIGAMADCRRISEHLLRQVYCELREELAPSAKESASKVIDKLDSYGCFHDQSVLAAAHHLRVAGNWALHSVEQESVAPEDVTSRARDCVGQLLRVREWRDGEASTILGSSRACSNCERLIGREDKCCPFCGIERITSCRACARTTKRGWRNCPDCGSQLYPRPAH